MNKRIAVIPGDGIGPEVVAQGLRVLEKVAGQVGMDYTTFEIPLGAEQYFKTGEVLPEGTKEKLAEHDAIFLGALGDPRVTPGVLERGILLELRFHFDQYINLRPVKLLDARYTPLKNKGPKEIDMLVVRENTEGLYAGIGGVFKKGTPDEVATQEMIATRKGVERCIRYAFEQAKKRRKHVTIVDKCNVLTYAHGLWQRVFKEVAAEYPDIQTGHSIIDACTMQMVTKPEMFDVIVTSNMFGDIITDLGAAIQGGMGLAASANLNPEGLSMFEPVHGSAPDIAGKGIANPLATILAVGMMLEHFGYPQGAQAIEAAVAKALTAGQVTREMGGDLSTEQMGDWILAQL